MIPGRVAPRCRKPWSFERILQTLDGFTNHGPGRVSPPDRASVRRGLIEAVRMRTASLTPGDMKAWREGRTRVVQRAAIGPRQIVLLASVAAPRGGFPLRGDGRSSSLQRAVEERTFPSGGTSAS